LSSGDALFWGVNSVLPLSTRDGSIFDGRLFVCDVGFVTVGVDQFRLCRYVWREDSTDQSGIPHDMVHSRDGGEYRIADPKTILETNRRLANEKSSPKHITEISIVIEAKNGSKRI
jgi:hypothetical protein